MLTERDVKNVECQEAYGLAQSGAVVLIDVRESQDFEKASEAAFYHSFSKKFRGKCGPTRKVLRLPRIEVDQGD